jgi:micrococcal nuclease
MVRARQVRSAALLVCLGALVVVVAVLGVRAVVDLAQGLRVLGGEGATEAPADRDGDLRHPGHDEADDGDHSGAEAPDGVPEGAQRAVIDRVVDGDTIRVRVDEPDGPIPPTDSVRVRLLNVDAPELDHPDHGRDCGARESTEFVEQLTPPGTTVWLVADVEDRDRYDRPLRGVFNERGVFVNAELVRAGWAEAVLFPPNDRFHQRMIDLEEEARIQGRGAWRACDGFP